MNYYKSINKTELNEWIDWIIGIRDLEAFLIQPLTNKKLNIKVIDNKIVDYYGHYRISTHTMTINLDGHRNLGQLIDTIAHELAHIDVIDHNRYHTARKMLYKRLIKICLNERMAAA